MTKILASIRGELRFMSRENIEVKEYNITGKELLTESPNIIIDEDASKTFNLIRWFKEWDTQLCCEYSGIIPFYSVKLILLPTLNDAFDDLIIRKKYNDKEFLEVTGAVGSSVDGRFKVGRRIFYNWFTTAIHQLRKGKTNDNYLYMEITALNGGYNDD